MPTTPIHLEILIRDADWPLHTVDEVDEPLDEALMAAGAGEVTGGGTGGGATRVEVRLDRLEEGLAIVQRELRRAGVPDSTILRRRDRPQITWPALGDDVN